MRVSVEKVSSIKKKISFEIPSERVETEIDKAFDKIRKRAAIKGFRKGKVPQALIEKHFSDQMAEDVLKSIFNETFYNALHEHGIYPVSQPMIESDVLKKGEPLKYSATFEVMPEIDLKEYTGLKLNKEKYVFDAEAIESKLKQLQENMAQLEPVADQRPVAPGDFVTVDFKGLVAGEPIDQGAAEDYMLEIGSGQFIPGFEEQVVGMEAGDEKEITVTFPEQYGNRELAGKEALFLVKLKEIKVKKLPELDDEFARGLGEFETLDQVKAKLGEAHEKQESERISAQLRERLIQALVEKNEFEVPGTLVDRQLDLMLDNAKKRLSSQRLTLEMLGLDDERFRSQYRETALNQVKGDLLLDAVAEKEGIKVGESDIEAEIGRIAASMNQDPEKVKGYYAEGSARDGLTARLREEKTIAFLLERAEVTEVTKEEL